MSNNKFVLQGTLFTFPSRGRSEVSVSKVSGADSSCLREVVPNHLEIAINRLCLVYTLPAVAAPWTFQAGGRWVCRQRAELGYRCWPVLWLYWTGSCCRSPWRAERAGEGGRVKQNEWQWGTWMEGGGEGEVKIQRQGDKRERKRRWGELINIWSNCCWRVSNVCVCVCVCVCVWDQTCVLHVRYLLLVILRDVAEELTSLPEQDILLTELFL